MVEPKKVIFKVGLHDNKIRRKVMKAIASVQGVESIHMDVNDEKLTVVGVFDPIKGHKKLRRVCVTDILSVEIVKQEEKKDEPKKEEPKKEEEKKDEKKDQSEPIKVYPYEPFNSYNMPQHFYLTTAEEHPNCCVIC